MNARHALVLTALLALAGLAATPVLAAAPEPTATVLAASASVTTSTECRSSAGGRIDLAQGMPVDCCKGHKGICGCRAGKIVCCDGTVSKDPNCTCHADSGVEN